jgi:hypothetical protein
MTLLGNVILSGLWESGKYRVIPFGGSNEENEAIEVYPGATLRGLGLRRYKSQPTEAIRVLLHACESAGITLDINADVLRFCLNYSSGGGAPDYDGADAFAALCTAILYREGQCRAATGDEPTAHRFEGAIWVPRLGLAAGSA